jgi:transposase-like protein
MPSRTFLALFILCIAVIVMGVITGTKGSTLKPAVHAAVRAGSAVYTDQWTGYTGLSRFDHQIVNHAETYVDGRVHTNGIENFWSLLKRGLNGT